MANVLVNYDLPWNPMIVEQRIGRIQRLASNHAHVVIYNITLRGTFEDYIVARLMEKLQMASQAIGDLELLLQGSDIGDGDEDPGESFEERIRKLVLAALSGKDVQKATELEVKSIEDGRLEWEREAENIELMLGSMDGVGYVGPRAPALPTAVRSMPARDFTLAALQTFGAQVTPYPPDLFIAEENNGREYIRFEEHASANIRSTYYAAGNAAFQRLVSSNNRDGHSLSGRRRPQSGQGKRGDRPQVGRKLWRNANGIRIDRSEALPQWESSRSSAGYRGSR